MENKKRFTPELVCTSEDDVYEIDYSELSQDDHKELLYHFRDKDVKLLSKENKKHFLLGKITTYKFKIGKSKSNTHDSLINEVDDWFYGVSHKYRWQH